MPLTVLTDEDVRTLLHSLNRDHILHLQQSLADALHYYSSGDETNADNGCLASFQPMRTVIKHKNGSATLFMPGSSTEGLGFKVVTLADTSKVQAPPSLSSATESSTSSLSNLSLGSDPSRSSSSTAVESIPGYPITDVPSQATASISSTTPSGSLTLLDKAGAPRAFINASEITAFRTALASTMLFNKRQNVHDVAIFGAGKQAYWHARLALLLRGPEIHHLNIINRSFETGVGLTKLLFKTPGPIELARPQTEIITPEHSEYTRHLKNIVRSASVIFFTTPSTQPLFPPELLTATEGRKKGRYLAAIGSYKPHMVEIHPDIIRQAVAPPHHHHHHRHAKQGGAVVVDSVEACLKEAGELIQAGLGGREVVELGELVMLKRDSEKRKLERESTDSSSLEDGVTLGRKKKKNQDDDDGGLKEWLERGNVIYKSVGMALMDCVVGNELVRLADEKSIGTRFDNF